MDDEPPIDTLMVEVIECRDRAIDAIAMNVEPTTKGAAQQRWARALAGADTSGVLGVMIPDAVDETVFRVLLAIDNGDLELYMKDGAGGFVSLADLGDHNLAGQYLDEQGGWRVTLSHRPAHPF